MHGTEFSHFTLGSTLVRYVLPADGKGPPGLQLIPVSLAGKMVAPRAQLDEPCVQSLPARWLPLPAGEVDGLAQIHVRGDPRPAGFSLGRSLRGGPSTAALQLVDQTEQREGSRHAIVTRLRSPCGLELEHSVSHHPGGLALGISTVAHNLGPEPVTLELFSTFSLGGITPFHPSDAPGRLFVHRFRSAWSAEGRHECRALEELQLERSWSGYGVACERFGQVGSMPVNGWFPRVAIEDRAAGVFWGAQLAEPGSWQLEVFRRGDQVALSGGLADRELGHWTKTLQPGESLVSAAATVACVAGSLDEACDALTNAQRRSVVVQPPIEHHLPIVFNEWCTSWGNPTHESLIALADRLRGSGVRYIVIDDGWAERDPAVLLQQNGDWRVNRTAFPDGLRATCDALSERGFIPGLWFEFEVVNAGTEAFRETAHQLHLDGVPLQVGTRRFWDFRDPWVHDYLADRVIRLLRDNNIGYLKVDYNDTIGFGCDGGDSPGEALRQHLAGVQAFLRRLRAELPGLVIENCSSGGHRLEPSFQSLSAIGGFSDAHETPEIPIIAANLQRLILARQSLVWAVLRSSDSPERLVYSLAATFLGRMCVSGEVHQLSPAQWQLVQNALALYRKAAPVIRNGTSRRLGEIGASWRHPTGWQAVVTDVPGHRLIVWHTFENSPPTIRISFTGTNWWHAVSSLHATNSARWFHVGSDGISIEPQGDWKGGVILLSG